nr:MAG TPA: hypothetical protein [Caudoviricetes sp.]DAS85889.1 MAG TPA: hypothetical protein [Caudoviricetes sp.]
MAQKSSFIFKFFPLLHFFLLKLFIFRAKCDKIFLHGMFYDIPTLYCL